MSNNKSPFVLLAQAGMELSWLLAIGVTIFSLAGVPPLSIYQAVAAFFAGMGLTLYIKKYNWRVISRLALYFLVFIVLLLHSLFSVIHRGESFWSPEWVFSLLQGPQNFGEGLIFAAIVFTMIIFFLCGIFLARRSLSYLTTASRFDVGITVLVLIFIITGTTDAPVTPVMLLLFPYFLTSMIAIALARNQKGDKRGAFQQKYRGNGPILAFAVGVLLAGGTVLLFFLPFLTMAAEAGHAAMLQYGSPLGTLLGKLILFLFGYGRQMSRRAPEDQGGDSFLIDPESVTGKETGLFEMIFSWGTFSLIVVISLFVIGWSFLRLLSWLLSGAEPTGKRRSIKNLFLLHLQKWLLFLRRMLKWFNGCLIRIIGEKNEGEASHFFKRLLVWGRWSGFDRHTAETPREYGLVLGRHFQGLQGEINLIIHCFHDEVYGKMTLDRERKKLLQRSWRKLCNPCRWPLRFYKRITIDVNMETQDLILKPGIKKKGNKKTNNGSNI